jgi:predicted MFS family arabinose efflux permease
MTTRYPEGAGTNVSATPYGARVSRIAPDPTEGALDPQVRRALGPLVASRFVSNLSVRFVYPFLPTIARGLGVSLETAGLAVSVRELSGVAGPQVGQATDRGRHRSIMLASLALLSVGTAAGGLSTGVVLFTVAMAVVAFTQMSFMISSAAWLAERVTYARRGAVFGLTELSWAGAFLFGVPVLGLVIERYGWRVPFFVVAALAAVLTVALAGTVPADRPHPAGAARPTGRRHPGALAVYVVVGLLSIAVQLVIVVYGAWFEDAFGFSVAAIGLATIVVGSSEFLGSGATVVLTDRWGKRRSILVGLAVMAPAAALLGTVGDRTGYGLVLLGLTLVGFEFAFVSSLPLVAELDTGARGRALGTGAAVATVARAVGSVLGTVTYTRSGIALTGGLTAVIAVGAAGVLLLGATEPEH